MKTYNFLGVGVIIFFILSGCATNNSIQAVVFDEFQTLSYEKNFQVLTSRKELYGVRIIHIADIIEPYHTAEFGLIIHNDTDEILNFSHDNIKAYCGSNSLKVFTYDEALADFERKNNVNLAGLAPEQIISIANARSQTGFYKKKDREYEEYASSLFKRQSIPPKSYHHGLIKIASPNPLCDELIIEIGDTKEIHKFVFQLHQR